MKSILIDINEKDKFMSWVDNGKKAVIVGGLTQDMATESMKSFIRANDYKCNFGYYNGCNKELLTRLINVLCE